MENIKVFLLKFRIQDLDTNVSAKFLEKEISLNMLHCIRTFILYLYKTLLLLEHNKTSQERRLKRLIGNLKIKNVC